MDSSTEAVEVSQEVVRALARALGIAWVGATLYSDPLEQEAFSKAAERISHLSGALPPITVTARTLRIGDKDLGDEGLSIAKMAHACFIHGIGVLRLTREVTPRSLATFMEIVQLEPEMVAHEGGLARLLKRRLVLGVEVFAHLGALQEADQLTNWDERWSWSAESLTAVLEATKTELLGPTLQEGFAGSKSITSVKERQAAVTAHIEALMNLRPGVQAALLDWLFERDDAAVGAVFDHLATHELLRLSQHLTEPAVSQARYLLSERGVDDPSWHPLDLVTVVGDLGVDRPTIPPASEWRDAMTSTMTNLFESDLGRDEQGKLVDVWASVFDSLLTEGQFEAGAEWLELPGRMEDPGFHARVGTRRNRMPSRDGLRALVDGVTSDPEGAVPVLAAALQTAPVHLLTLLGALPDEVVSPALDALAEPIRGNEEVLLDQLPGLERPLSLALRLLVRSGYDGAGDPRLEAFVNHESAEVRFAVMPIVRSSLTLEQLRKLIGDRSHDVKALAVIELSERGDPAIEILTEAILSMELSDDTVILAAKTLMGMKGGAKALERAAQDVQLLVSGQGRALRKRLQAIAKGKV